jgi:hypothetical protein
MSLPEDFNSSEHLQDVIRKVHNALVLEEFKDVHDIDDIHVPRSSLKIACAIKDDDSWDMIQARYNLFYLDLRKARDYQVPVYGIPLPDLQAQRTFKPQITLKFIELQKDVEPGYQQVTGEISFRLMDEDSISLTKAKIKTLTASINRIFITGGINGFNWKKGKKYYSYTDKEKGYQLQLLSRDESNVISLIHNILEIQNHTYDSSRLKLNQTGLNTSDENKAFPINPKTLSILEKDYKAPRKRPNADVNFYRAELSIYGLPKAIILIDKLNVDFYGTP